MKHLTESRECKNCGKTFSRRLTNHHRILCDSAICKVEWQKKTIRENSRNRRSGKVLDRKNCIICGDEFQPKTKLSKCCSDGCIYQNTIKRNRERYHQDPAFRENVLKNAKDYALKNPEKVRIDSLIRVRKWRVENKRKYQAQSNEKRFGGNWLKVMDRDGWICRLCDKDAQVIHHRDKDTKNNDPFNLTALCRSCHAKVHHDDIHNNLNV